MAVQFNSCIASRFLAGIALIVATSSASAGQPPQYTAQLITPDLSAINAAAMNEAGDVVGTGTTGSGAWVSIGGAPAVLLPLPPGAQFAFANDINDEGVIVGAAGPASSPGFGKAVAWIPDGAGGYIIQQFGTLPGHVSSGATAVNNVGDIIGSSHNGTFSYPVLFTALGGIQDLSFTGIFDPVDINDQRVLIDHSFTCKKLDLNTMQVQNLGVPAGPPNYLASRGEAINESGQVAGSVILPTSTSCSNQAARFADGIGWEVLSVCGWWNSAWDMNNLGDLVMQLNTQPYVRFEGIGTFLIEDLIVADVGHWYVINGYGLTINDSRQLAVPATNSVTNEGGIILLTPIPIAGDLNGDGAVDVNDLLAVIGAWGPCPAPPVPCPADIAPAGGDGFVDVNDLLLVIANWS